MSIAAFEGLPFFATPVLSTIRRVHLHGVVTSAGHEWASGNYSFSGLERGDRPFAVLQLTLRGRGALRYEERSYDLLPGSLLVVSVPHDHRYYLPQEQPYWEFVYVCVTGQEFLRFLDELPGGPVFMAEQYPFLIKGMGEILNHVHAYHPPDEFYLSASMYRLLMGMISRKYRGADRAVKNRHVRFARRYCLSRIDEPFTIEEVARQAGIDRSHLSREFKRVLGISPSRFIENLRMERASTLLLSRDLPVREVGVRCGYRDVSYFCRAFKKHFSVSPGRYRKSHE